MKFPKSDAFSSYLAELLAWMLKRYPFVLWAHHTDGDENFVAGAKLRNTNEKVRIALRKIKSNKHAKNLTFCDNLFSLQHLPPELTS